MPTIIYQGQTYTIDAVFDLTFSHEGDAHGNNNIFSSTQYPTAYQVLRQIAPQAVDETVAVTIDGVAVPLDTKLKGDHQLECITLAKPLGQLLRSRTTALLIARAVAMIAPQALLTHCTINEQGCQLDLVNVGDDLSLAAVKERFSQFAGDDHAILVSDAWQKAWLTENYPSLQSPYAQHILAPYDDFDSVPVAICGDYALPYDEALVAIFPHVCAQASLSCTLTAQTLSIEATFAEL